jgi:hypothetical protein
MIIIKTKNGDVMVNEKSIRSVTQNKKERLAFINSKNGSETIKDVESVLYFNDVEAIQYKDEGSEVEELKKRLEDRLEWINNLRKEYTKIEQERDMLQDKLTNLENRIKASGELKGEKKSQLNFRAISPMLGDCTTTFEVDGCDKMTVYDFAMEVIKRDRYVDLDFKRDGSYIWHVRYNEQRPRPEDMEKKPEDIQDMLVKSARCNGGWGQMSYDVILYDSVI